MKRHWIIAGLILTCAVAVAAQPRPRAGKKTTTSPGTQPAPIKSTDAAAPPAQAPAPSPSDNPAALAIVNDVTLTSADIESAVSSMILNDPDLYLQAFYQDREKAIK